jgi:molybdopterin biosynthesis enzyme MoaB
MRAKRNPIAKSLRSPHLQPKVIADKRRKALREACNLQDGECFDCGLGVGGVGSACTMNCGTALPPETNEGVSE